MKPDERLAALSKLFLEKSQQYGQSYQEHGKLMTVLFPIGAILKTVEDFNRFAIFEKIVDKLYRYANNFYRPGAHPDSLDDIAVYCQMLRHLDEKRSAYTYQVERRQKPRPGDISEHGNIRSKEYVKDDGAP